MSDRPIIFDAESVRDILDGSKTQTRRVVKPQPEYYAERQWLARVDVHTMPGWAWYDRAGRNGFNGVSDCAEALASFAPYELGDRLWVREAWRVWGWTEDFDGMDIGYTDGSKRWGELPDDDRWQDWMEFETNRFSRLPRGKWRSPIHMPRWASRLTLEITGVRVERVQDIDHSDAAAEGCNYGFDVEFEERWDTLNKRRGFGWDSNPWVWVISFRRVQS